MPLFLAGLALGGISSGLTYAYTGNPQLTAAAGILAAIITWLGIASVIYIHD